MHIFISFRPSNLFEIKTKEELSVDMLVLRYTIGCRLLASELQMRSTPIAL